MANIEQLKKETDEIKKWLEDLKKNVSLSKSEKKEKAEKLKSQAETTKQRIQAEIDLLSDKTDDESKKNKEEAEALLTSFDEIMNLYASILETSNSEDLEGQELEEKGLFWKAKDWVWEQWDDVWSKEKWKDELWKNLLRTAWFTATWIWAIALTVKWIKKLWNWAFWDKDEDNEEEQVEDKEKTEDGENTEDVDKKSKKKNKKKKKSKKEKSESSWRKKFLVWAWLTAWTVVWWVEIYKHRNRISSRVKEKLWLSLSFDQARQKVESEVRNWKVDDDHFWVFNAHFEWGITYDENTQEICSYWEKTKIEKKWKKLQWMNVEFASWEELIHAANIVNFAKRKLKWRWANATPFCQTSRWGDIAFNCSANWQKEFLSASNSNEWSWILWTLGTVWWWILWAYCAWVKWAAIWVVWWWTWWYALWAYIDNNSTAGSCCETICRGKNFDKFLNYLNSQTDENWKSLRESGWEQRIDPNETPISDVVDNWGEWNNREWILAEIENAYWEDQTWRRNLKIEWNESNPKEYTVSSYNHKLKMIIEWLPTKKWEKTDFTKIKKIHIEKYEKYDSRWDWLDIEFPHTKEWLKEAIKTANLTNMIVEDWKWKWWEAYPFFWWRYSTPPSLDMDVDWFRWKTILSRDAAKKFPTLFEDLKEWSNWWFWTALWFTNSYQRKMHEQAVNDKSEWSQYIKFLHQIGKWNFWKKK